MAKGMGLELNDRSTGGTIAAALSSRQAMAPNPPPASPANAAASTRQRLIETAAHLFLERGYHATSVAAILEESGVHAGSLYHCFEGKEALLMGVLEAYLGLLGPVVIDPVEALESDPIERVFRLLAFYRERLAASGFTRGCPIGNLALELGDQIPAARVLIERNFAGWIAAVARWIEAAGARLPAGTDARALAVFVLTTMEGAVMLARARGSLAPFDEAVATLREHFRLLERAAG
jgi:AcrR family transcriptional regulator